MTNGHGDDLYRYTEGCIKANFSSNIYATIDNEDIKRHIAQSIPRITDTYPEPIPYSTEAQWGTSLGIAADGVLLTAGATDAIYAIASTMRYGMAAVVQPTFSEYADACRTAGLRYTDVYSMDEGLNLLEAHKEENDLDADRLLWLCNPNNPDGRLMPREELLFRADAYPDIIFIVDISYAAFVASGAVLSEADAVCRPNLILIRSLTKQYKLPGLRIGGIVCNALLAGRIRATRMPWAVSAPALEALRYILCTYPRDYLPIDRAILFSERDRLCSAMASLGVSVAPTDTHYMLCCLPGHCSYTATTLKETLAREYGLLIRDASNFVGLTPQHFRIATQSSAENNLLINALQSLLIS